MLQLKFALHDFAFPMEDFRLNRKEGMIPVSCRPLPFREIAAPKASSLILSALKDWRREG